MERQSVLHLIVQAAEEQWEELDLSGMGLSELPPEIGNLVFLKRLILGKWNQGNHLVTGNYLVILPEELRTLQTLEELHLACNQLSTLPKWIGQLTNLTFLDLSGNQLNTLPESISQSTNLTSLDLASNQLSTLPKWISQLTNLAFLDLSGNQLNTLPESISQLTNLTSLDLASNQLSTLPKWIGQLTNLTFLDLNFNQLNTVPKSISQLTNLTSLGLNFNELNTVAEWIGQLTNLTSLNLARNQLKNVPEWIGQLTNLNFLDLARNQLKNVPEWIGQLTNLTSLNFEGNQLKNVPEWIGQLTNLISLDLGDNQLKNLPESISQLTNLTSLDLGDNQLKNSPESISQLTNLASLNLKGNQLKNLPESISQLTNLTSLNLGNNQLKDVPEWIDQLIHLTSLNFSYNRLDTLPESISQLTNLTSLDLGDNQLDTLPESIGRLTNLTELFLTKNPLTQIDPVILHQGGLAVRNYYRQRLEANTTYIYEAKLLIIGKGGAGKTSLANKLIDSSYKLKPRGSDNYEKSTEGIDVLRFDFPHSSGNSFRINIWDFGGQEIYHATHQFFLTKRSLYLLVANALHDDTDFNYWLKVIELLSGGSPALIVKNQEQERRCRINENQLRGRFGNLKDILPTNLASNDGLPEILTAVKHYISQLPHVGNPLPKTWVRVREALEADARNYITQTEFLTLCDTYGFKRREDKLQLSGYLHDLGVCLHFQEDSVLKNWIILKPEWGTAAVYKVLDNPKVQQALGCFNHDDLATIWADEQYADMRDELLQLMMRFKLCYEIPNHPHTYIAPQLLSPNQPEYTWDDTDNLILRYHYDFMPKGMLTRFAVETHKLIDSDLIWRDGIILYERESRAEVIEAYYENEIRIRVSGFPKKDLLTRIHHEFDKIHDSYEDLQFKELIPCNCPICKGSQKPHPYELDKLKERLQNQVHQAECDKPPYHKVQIHSLIDDSIGQSNPTQVTQNNSYAEATGSTTNLNFFINAGNSKVNDQSPKNTSFNLKNPNIGAIATDQAQATVIGNTFTQNHNANTAELLQLITTLRAVTTQFPQEIQGEIVDDIDDIETEIKKPEDQRNSIRLKKRLVALLTAISLIAAPIAATTDFTNNVLEIGNKLHIELQQLPKAP
jgi:internalin A